MKDFDEIEAGDLIGLRARGVRTYYREVMLNRDGCILLSDGKKLTKSQFGMMKLADGIAEIRDRRIGWN